MSKLTRPLPRSWTLALGGLLSLCFVTLLGIILDLVYHGNLPSSIQVVPFYDKVGHVGLYGIGAYLGHRLLRRFLSVS